MEDERWAGFKKRDVDMGAMLHVKMLCYGYLIAVVIKALNCVIYQMIKVAAWGVLTLKNYNTKNRENLSF